MRDKIGVIINYCSNDYRFIGHNIRQVSFLKPQKIIVTYTDHFYNGDPEDYSLIHKTIKENPGVKFIEVKYQPIKPPIWEFICRLLPRTFDLRPLYGPQYWPCKARWEGYCYLKKKVDYILFLDADEIIDGKKFQSWLDTGEYQKFDALIFACYFYFYKPIYQAKTWEECGLLVKDFSIPKKVFLSYNERRNIYSHALKPKRTFVLGLDNKPMIHHYSWVGTKEELLKKVHTWGHSQERDWEKIIIKKLSPPFKGTDFLRHYCYKKVAPFVNLSG